MSSVSKRIRMAVEDVVVAAKYLVDEADWDDDNVSYIVRVDVMEELQDALIRLRRERGEA